MAAGARAVRAATHAYQTAIGWPRCCRSASEPQGSLAHSTRPVAGNVGSCIAAGAGEEDGKRRA
eukprot:6512685-Alexandrium_andersonii.AAC.1